MKCALNEACVDVAPLPRQLYESCTVASQYNDDCDRGLTCLAGLCTQLCRCSVAYPHCDAEGTDCYGWCLPRCDPFSPQCPGQPEPWACGFESLGFHCRPRPADAITVSLGEACVYMDECIGPGEAPATCYGYAPDQLPPARVPGCNDDYACCLELCRLTDPHCSQPNAVCSPLQPAVLYHNTAPCFGDVGGCLLPE
jgi:hypothetical protein